MHTHSTLNSIKICDADIPFFLLSALTSCLHSFYITYDSDSQNIRICILSSKQTPCFKKKMLRHCLTVYFYHHVF